MGNFSADCGDAIRLAKIVKDEKHPICQAIWSRDTPKALSVKNLFHIFGHDSKYHNMKKGDCHGVICIDHEAGKGGLNAAKMHVAVSTSSATPIKGESEASTKNENATSKKHKRRKADQFFLPRTDKGSKAGDDENNNTESPNVHRAPGATNQ